MKHIIDLDADPSVPKGWAVQEHKGGGHFEWDLSKVRFYWSPNQMEGRRIKGKELRIELTSEPVFNATLLDFLLANESLIPDDWSQDKVGYPQHIFFWGTIYYNLEDCEFYVRYMYRGAFCWLSKFYPMDLNFDDDDPALSLVA